MTDTFNALEPILSFLHRYVPYTQMRPVHQEYLAMYLEQVFYAENDIILKSEDGLVDRFYIIKQGSVSVEKEPLRIAETILGPGDCFPITGLLQNSAVNFQHRAIKSTICYKLKQSHFEYLMQQSDVFRHFCTQKNLDNHTE